MKKIFLIPLAVFALLALTALNPFKLLAPMSESAVPVMAGPLAVSSTSTAYFIPTTGYVRLVCSQPTYYKVVSASTGTASSSDSLNYGTVGGSNGIAIQRPSWINITSNQWLALITRGGVSGLCLVEQVGTDGTAGSFTTLAVSSTSTFGGVAQFGGAIDAGVVAAAGAINNQVGDNIIAGTKTRGTLTLNGGSPATITATVNSGAVCVCSNNTTTTNDVKCAVSSTTLTITGPNAATDSVTYICVQ